MQSVEPLGSVFSPDGRWIAYHARDTVSGQVRAGSAVYVEPFPATGAQYQAPKINIDFQPVWAPDGRELIYVPSAASGRLAIVSVSTRAGMIFGPPQTIPAAVTLSRTSGLTRMFDVLPDGRFIGLVAGAETSESRDAESQEIRVVLNWYDQLKRLVPTK